MHQKKTSNHKVVPTLIINTMWHSIIINCELETMSQIFQFTIDLMLAGEVGELKLLEAFYHPDILSFFFEDLVVNLENTNVRLKSKTAKKTVNFKNLNKLVLSVYSFQNCNLMNWNDLIISPKSSTSNKSRRWMYV